MSVSGLLLRGFGLASGGGGGAAPAVPTLTVADVGNGTATATIAGSSALSANIVYTREVGGTAWTNSGSRTADGTVLLTLAAGYYYAYVQSTLNSQAAASAPYRFRVTDSVTAVYNQILLAVQVEIQDLDLTGVTDANVVLLKTPTTRDRDLPSTKFPAVIICPWENVTFGVGTNRKDDPIYPVLVALVNPENQDQATNRARTLKWTQDVRRRFHLPAQGAATDPFSGITEVFNSTVDTRPVYNLGDWYANVGVTGFVIRVSAREVRTV